GDNPAKAADGGSVFGGRDPRGTSVCATPPLEGGEASARSVGAARRWPRENRKIREACPAGLRYAGSHRRNNMVQRISHASVFVLDQDAAKDFYVNKLGFELRFDSQMQNGFRWLTVGAKAQPDLSLILMKVDGPNIAPEVAATLKRFLEEGKLSGGVLHT